MKTYDLLVIGEINPDFIIQGIDLIPEFNQTEKLVDNAQLTIGASSVIMACGAARLGLRVAYIGLTGNDLFGQYMLKEMESLNIDISHVVVDEQLSTGISVILTHQHDRAILTYPGAIPRLRKDHIPTDLLQHARHLHLGSYFLLDDLIPDVPDLFRMAHRYGVTTSLDTNWDPRGEWDVSAVLPYCDIFFPNENELLNISGKNSIDDSFNDLSNQIGVLVVKLGEKGAQAHGNGNTAYSQALKVSVIDSVGAGDSFDAGFIFGWLNDFSLQKSLDIACVCGSLSTRCAGGTKGQASTADLQNYGLLDLPTS